MISTKKTATINFHFSVTLEWFGRLPNTLNYFVHWWQEKVISPLCTLIQILRMSILLNDFVHRKTLDVDVHSPLQKVTQHTKWFRTLKAVVGILIRVYSLHVVLKDTFLWKTCFTKLTVVWFLSSVQSNVGLKVRFLCKRFFTQWTAVRFL